MKSIFISAISFCMLSSVYAQDAPIKAYNNYDFIPGEKILFEDDFHDSPDGEFPPRWDLKGGQAVINQVTGRPAFFLSEGNYAIVEPLMKTKSYLPETFTVEFDYYSSGNEYGVMVFFKDAEEYSTSVIFDYDGRIASTGFENDLEASYPGDGSDFTGKWHHAALICKGGQMKCYLDQYRVLVMPRMGYKPASIQFGGIAPIIFTNVKIAEGGGMNMLGKILTEGKFVSHAIKFDTGKSTIKGESMGFLNELAKWLKENPAVNLEIGGHTDSDGEDASNMKLSQSRADAVKAQLVSLGVDGSRLTAKGYGENKPADNNSTPEGKANNRRVEFVKI